MFQIISYAHPLNSHSFVCSSKCIRLLALAPCSTSYIWYLIQRGHIRLNYENTWCSSTCMTLYFPLNLPHIWGSSPLPLETCDLGLASWVKAQRRNNIREQWREWGSGYQCKRRQEEALCTQWTFFTTDCGSQWHMKYERQQHSPLFIALQERKRKIEKAATPHTLQGRAGIIFSFAKEELRPKFFRMHICHGNGIGQASPYSWAHTSSFHSEKLNKSLAISFTFELTGLNRCSGEALVVALCCRFVTIQTHL